MASHAPHRIPAHAPHIPKDDLTGYNPETHKYDKLTRDSAECWALKQKFNIANRRQAGVPLSDPEVKSWSPVQSIADALTVSSTPALIEACAKKDWDTAHKH